MMRFDLQTCLLVAGFSVWSGGPAAAEVNGVTARALVDRYCTGCHSDRLRTGGLSLAGSDWQRIGAEGEVAEKIVRKLRAGAMPPLGAPRPAADALTGFRVWLESELDRTAAVHPVAGRPATLHRLNRAEYANVIRDLLDLQGYDVAALLPGDDASYGFDNIAGVNGI